MENRYVYRRIEDAIGAPLDIKDSPHAWITRKLRYDLREQKDIARHTEMNALCLASLAGNSRLDATQISDAVNDMLIDALSKKIPYAKKLVDEEKAKPKETNFDQYFEQLEEMKKEIEAKNKAKKEKEASQKVDKDQ